MESRPTPKKGIENISLRVLVYSPLRTLVIKLKKYLQIKLTEQNKLVEVLNRSLWGCKKVALRDTLKQLFFQRHRGEYYIFQLKSSSKMCFIKINIAISEK